MQNLTIKKNLLTRKEIRNINRSLRKQGLLPRFQARDKKMRFTSGHSNIITNIKVVVFGTLLVSSIGYVYNPVMASLDTAQEYVSPIVEVVELDHAQKVGDQVAEFIRQKERAQELHAIAVIGEHDAKAIASANKQEQEKLSIVITDITESIDHLIDNSI